MGRIQAATAACGGLTLKGEFGVVYSSRQRDERYPDDIPEFPSPLCHKRPERCLSRLAEAECTSWPVPFQDHIGAAYSGTPSHPKTKRIDA